VILLNTKIKKSFLSADLFTDASYTYIKNVSVRDGDVRYAKYDSIVVYAYRYVWIM